MKATSMRAPARRRHRSEGRSPPKASIWASLALDKLYAAVTDWVHRPSQGKEAILHAYERLTERERNALDAHTRDVFLALYGSLSTTMYRYRDTKKSGLSSVSPREPLYLGPGKYVAYRIFASDVLAHYGQEDSPLGTRAFGHEKEVILKPDATRSASLDESHFLSGALLADLSDGAHLFRLEQHDHPAPCRARRDDERVPHRVG